MTRAIARHPAGAGLRSAEEGLIPLVKLVGGARGPRAFTAPIEALLDTLPLHPAMPGSISQFTSGAWVVVLTVPAFMLLFARI